MTNQESKDGSLTAETAEIGLADLQRVLDDFLNYYVLRRSMPSIDYSLEELNLETEKFDRVVMMLVGYFISQSNKNNELVSHTDFMRDLLRELLKKHFGEAKGPINPDNVEKIFYMAACKKMAELYNRLFREHKKISELMAEIRQKLEATKP